MTRDKCHRQEDHIAASSSSRRKEERRFGAVGSGHGGFGDVEIRAEVVVEESDDSGRDGGWSVRNDQRL